MNEDSTTPPAYTAPVRVKAILDELDRAADEYIQHHKLYQEAQVHFRAARERFASVKRIAGDLLSFTDWFDWQERRGNVRYAAMAIGEAIRDALRDRACASASHVVHTHGPGISPQEAMSFFSPGMTPEQLVEALERGGFEFKGAPRRQIHAALLHLDGVNENEGTYSIGDADEILQVFMSDHGPAEETPDDEDIEERSGSLG